VNRPADVPQPAERVTVRRWQRFEFDRLYGHAADGRNIGWVDLDTGERSIELPGFAEAFERTVEAWARGEREVASRNPSGTAFGLARAC
jgi:hypothetical protein